MPDWAGLTSYLAEIANIPPDGGGPAVASEFERRFGRVQLIEAIRKALHIDHTESSEAHQAFAGLPFDTVYTTNFDLLLEDAFIRVRKPFRSIVGELQMPFHGGPLITSIVKMHGDLRHEEHVIVTAEDYEKYLENYPVIATHLSAQLITRTPLFIGYSLTDPDFQNIRKVVKSRLGKFERMAYLIAFNSSQEECEKKLKENLHVISLEIDEARTKNEALTEIFQDIQERVDIREGVKFRAARPEIFESVSTEVFEQTSRGEDASSLLTSSSNLCFVMMPFGNATDWIYRDFIRPVAEQFGLSVVRADEIYSPGVITEQIRVAIQQSRLCIADVSNRNPNVLYEVGIAHTLGKPTIILTREIGDVPFDLARLRMIKYDPQNIQTARLDLERAIQHVLGEDRLDEASRLIEGGMYRAAAAILGVLLEHSLRRLADKYSNQVGSRLGRRPMSIGQYMRILTETGALQSGDVALLERVAKTRNLAVHALTEPTADDVRFMLSVVREFVEKYLGGWT